MTVVAEDGVRTRDRAVVEQDTKTRGADPIARHLQFAEGGVGGLWTTLGGAPMTISAWRAGIPASMRGRSPAEQSPR